VKLRATTLVSATMSLSLLGWAPAFATTEPPAGWLDADQRRRADQLISTFENSTTEIRYDYAENLGDGRGVTAGRSGFTTGTCDALEVIEAYTDEVGDNVLSPFTPELERLCDEESDDTSGLPEAAYIAAWHEAASDSEFRAAQDAVLDREYYIPAMEAADDLGLETALARAELYDAAVQHGAGDDLNGLDALIERATTSAGRPGEIGERDWLEAFFDVRIDDLLHPANQETAGEWSESIDRVECMRRIAATGNVDLAGPITFDVYGDEFTID
jgi:chitosanase